MVSGGMEVMPSKESDGRIIATNLVPVAVYVVLVAAGYMALKLIIS